MSNLFLFWQITILKLKLTSWEIIDILTGFVGSQSRKHDFVVENDSVFHNWIGLLWNDRYKSWDVWLLCNTFTLVKLTKIINTNATIKTQKAITGPIVTLPKVSQSTRTVLLGLIQTKSGVAAKTLVLPFIFSVHLLQWFQGKTETIDFWRNANWRHTVVVNLTNQQTARQQYCCSSHLH